MFMHVYVSEKIYCSSLNEAKAIIEYVEENYIFDDNGQRYEGYDIYAEKHRSDVDGKLYVWIKISSSEYIRDALEFRKVGDFAMNLLVKIVDEACKFPKGS